MKTTISILDKIFDAAERAARERGVSRSEFYVTAIEDYLRRNTSEKVTEELKKTYSDNDANGRLEPFVSALQLHSIRSTEW